MIAPTQAQLSATHATRMLLEAGEAPAVLQRQIKANRDANDALAARLRAQPPRLVLTCARGSSDHAATLAKYAIETRLGTPVASLPPSIASVYGVPQRLDDTLCLVISQSGKSPDLVRSAEAARDAGACVVALVNVEDSPLARLADFVLPLHAGPETSVAATKSYLASLAAIIDFVAHWSADTRLREAVQNVPDALQTALELDWTALADGLHEARHLFVIGRGYGLAAAEEMALKCKETSGLHAEAFSSAEVRHGPMALVRLGFPVLAIGQDDGTLAGTRDVVEAFRTRGARVWSAMPGCPGQDSLPVVPAADPLLAPMLAVASFYRAANTLALARGFNPDVPPFLNKVTETV